MSSDLSQPRRKKTFRENTNLPLPVFENSIGELAKFDGQFNGFSVTIANKAHMVKIYLNGFFGKGNLSRSYPNFVDDTKTSIIRKRQFDTRKSWAEKAQNSKKQESVIVVPDSDSDNEDYFKDLRPVYHLDKSNLKEELCLSLEEAFFLLDAVKCLNIYYVDKNLSSEEAWSTFAEADKFFPQNYVAYYYFRSKNYVVKSGLKFGGDLLLYKEGPAYYHATYVVIIDAVHEGTLERISNPYRRSMELQNVIGLHRLCETAGKDLLICNIIWPNANVKSPADIKNVSIKEILVKRWLLPNELKNNE